MADPPQPTRDLYAIAPAPPAHLNTQAARVTRRARFAREFGTPAPYSDQSLPVRRPPSWQTDDETS